jgi:hypothetical protein
VCEPFILRIPIKTVSESNSTDHWRKKSKRHKGQKSLVNFYYSLHNTIVKMPCHVILTRISPRKLDEGDNLPCSLKYIRDAIAACITRDFRPGRADGDNRITWQYKQRKEKPKEYAVEIEIIEQT